ncbi:hypothetical protein KC959_03310 [Candidatus Saccharibacteria bacterium]|nr:hypothetical protein [Candidatus Saccharibacteria bacterium]
MPSDIEQARLNGTNCYGLAALVCWHLFAQKLPRTMRGYEMFHDDRHFRRVDQEAPAVGDLVWLGYRGQEQNVASFIPQFNQSGWLINWRGFPVNHVGIVASTDEADSLILHASQEKNRTTIEPLSVIQAVKRYAQQYARQRLRAA